ncbi:MAG: adenylate/guanylate cyclase domain-containing protein [Deltaproteobacteria bacterium]|nr:adenylate/guanylate cyclase domain-containing protein [Deltaproteobacteria bacterium]
MLHFAKKRLLYGAIIALSTALLVNLGFYLGLFEGLERKAFDMRARYNSRQPSSEVAILLIDEASLRGMNPIVGRWPWPRSVHADVVDFLAMSGAKAVLFDILFTENERVFGTPRGVLAPSDERLVESTASAGNVYHAAQIVIDEEDEYNKGLLNRPIPNDFAGRFSVALIGAPVSGHNNYYLPFKELYTASKGTGIVEFLSDPDGVYRRTKLFRHYQGSFYPVLPVSPLLDIMKPETIIQEEDRIVLTGVQDGNLQLKTQNSKLKTLEIPLQKDGSYLINMHGDFRPYSMSGVLASIQKIKMGELEGLPVSPDEFKDKVVFIGGSAVGIEDLKPTSTGGNTPGVYLHASVYSNIIRGDFLRYTGPLITSLSILLLSVTVTIAILWSRNIIYYQLGVPFLLAFMYISSSFWWFGHNTVFDIIAPTMSIVISWMGTFAFLGIIEGKDKRKIKRMLSQYVSPSILSTLIDKSPQDVLKAGGGSKENLTILFSDIRGFTSISERLEAEQVVELLNGYLSEMVDVIFRHEGTLDKFIGDAIMALWGARIRINDHGKRTVLAALDMRRQLEAFNQRLVANGLIHLDMGVGINTGEVILGNIGSEKKLDYTIIGDNVNLASRMEGLTKEYGSPILITESTYEEVKTSIPCRIIDMVRVVGRKKGIRIYEPLDAREGDVTDKTISLSEEGFNYYLKRDWDAAIKSYSGILSIRPDDRLSEIFIGRCENYKNEEPPSDWDGVYTMMKK